jgi:hypothetical protein
MQNTINLHRHDNIQFLQNLNLFWLQQFTAFFVSQNSTACGWQDTMSGSSKTAGGHIRVVSCTRWSVDHGGKFVPVPLTLMKNIEGQPFIKMAVTTHPMDEIISGSRSMLLQGSLANNSGLKELKELRNVASGLVASQQGCLDDDDTENEGEPPAKQPVKRKRLANNGQPAAEHCPIVSFELPNYGLVKAARAAKCNEDLVLSMEGDALERAFNFIVDSDLEDRRSHNGSYKTKLGAGTTSSPSADIW